MYCFKLFQYFFNSLWSLLKIPNFCVNVCWLFGNNYYDWWANAYPMKRRKCAPVILIIVKKWRIHCVSFSALFKLVHCRMNHQLSEKNLWITDNFHCKPYHTTETILTLFAVNKDNWDKSIKNVLYALMTVLYQKEPLKTKPVA